MIIDEIRTGESQNIEFKRELPAKSEKYIKTLVAYANSSGGKLVIGVEDETHEIYGVDENVIPTLIDGWIENILKKEKEFMENTKAERDKLKQWRKENID